MTQCPVWFGLLCCEGMSQGRLPGRSDRNKAKEGKKELARSREKGRGRGTVLGTQRTWQGWRETQGGGRSES